MKKNLGMTAVALATALVLTGCSTTPTYAPSQTEAPAAPQLTDEDLYLQTLHSTGNSYVNNGTDAQLVQLGHTVCQALDEGNSVTDIVTYLVLNSNNDDPEFARFEGQVIGAAVGAFCPEYSGQISGY